MKRLVMFDDDYITRHMIEEFIIDEQEHYNWVKGHLCLIEQIGIPATRKADTFSVSTFSLLMHRPVNVYNAN